MNMELVVRFDLLSYIIDASLAVELGQTRVVNLIASLLNASEPGSNPDINYPVASEGINLSAQTSTRNHLQM